MFNSYVLEHYRRVYHGHKNRVSFTLDLALKNGDVPLVGGWATPLKNMNVNWDYYSQYMGKCQIHGNQLPPTR